MNEKPERPGRYDSATSVADRVRVVSIEEWKRIKAAQPKSAYEGYAAPLVVGRAA